MVFEFPHPKDKVLILKRIPVFSGCTNSQLLLIADRTRLVEYKKGESVYKEGDVADAFYIVISGRLRVFSKSQEQQKVFTVLHNGDSFGEISLLTGETHSADVQALNDTLVLQLQKEDFEDVINRIPSLVLHLSRLLSKRLRMREFTGEYAASESTIVGICSAIRGVGRSLLIIALAAFLKRDSNREIIVLDMNAGERDHERFYGTGKASPIKLTSVSKWITEQDISESLYEHNLGFSVLSVGALLSKPGGDEAVAPLLSALTKRYAYILIDMPGEMNALAIKLLAQSDLIYFMMDQHRDNLIKTKVLVRRVKETITTSDQRIKLIVRRIGGIGVIVNLKDIEQQIGIPVSYLLPHLGQLEIADISKLLNRHDSEYVLTVRRISRELSRSVVGLAFGSGAALGLAHIGVLKVIEREKIPIDMVAGTSIGALIGGLWAAGKSADELEQMAYRFKNTWDIYRLFIFDISIPGVSFIVGIIAGVIVGLLAGFWSGLLFGFVCCVALGLILGPLSGGPLQGKELGAKLERDFEGKTFQETRIPLKIIASNPSAREEVIFDSGSIAKAVRASVSIPGIFRPVSHMGKMCLDGGVINPVPVDVLKKSGAHRVIAINVFPTSNELTAHLEEVKRSQEEHAAHLASRSFPVRFFAWMRHELLCSMSPLVFDIIMRSMQTMEYQIAEISCQDADLTLRPSVAGSHWLEFFNPGPFIARGEEVATEMLPELKRLTGFHDDDVDNS